MCSCAQRSSLDGSPLLYPIVPQHNLTRIGAPQNQVGMKLGKSSGHDRTLTVENVFGRSFLKLGVPNKYYSIRVVGRLFVVVVRGQQQLWVLRRPVQRRDGPVLGPSLVVEATVEGNPLVRLLITAQNMSNEQI